MLRRLIQIAAYNKDWQNYLTSRFRAPDAVLEFRLRNGQRLQLMNDARFVLNEIYLDRVYDLPDFDYTSCRTVLDLGGNVGLFAFHVTARSPQAKVWSFEPSTRNLALFRENLRQNPEHAARINLMPMAVGERNETVNLSLAGSSVEYSTARETAEGGATEPVKCVDLATCFELCKVTEFDLAKIDIEGAELLVLDPASDQDIRRLKAMVIEWHHSTDRLQELAKRLRGLGFDASRVVIDGHMEFLHARRIS